MDQFRKEFAEACELLNPDKLKIENTIHAGIKGKSVGELSQDELKLIIQEKMVAGKGGDKLVRQRLITVVLFEAIMSKWEKSMEAVIQQHNIVMQNNTKLSMDNTKLSMDNTKLSMDIAMLQRNKLLEDSFMAELDQAVQVTDDGELEIRDQF